MLWSLPNLVACIFPRSDLISADVKVPEGYEKTAAQFSQNAEKYATASTFKDDEGAVHIRLLLTDCSFFLILLQIFSSSPPLRKPPAPTMSWILPLELGTLPSS